MTEPSRSESAFRTDLDAAVAASSVAPDIAAALADPAASTWLREIGFQVIEKIKDLRGPQDGTVLVPDLLANHTGETADLDDDAQLRNLYRRVLNGGTTADQAAVLNLNRLRLVWAPGLAEPVIMRVWETRFPEIRG